MATKLKSGDTVVVIAGRDKGAQGTIMSLLPDAHKAIVRGVNRVVRHVKVSQQYPKGGKISKEMPIHWSNLAVVDPKTQKPTRIGFRFNSDGDKERFAKASGESLGLVKTRPQIDSDA